MTRKNDESVIKGTTITKDTAVSIGIIMTIIGVVFGFGIEKNSSDVNAREIVGIKNEQRDYQRVVNDINTRLARIEGALKISQP